MTQSSNSSHSSQNWLDLVQFVLLMITVFGLFVAIALQPLFAVLLPALIAIGISFWRSRQEKAQISQLYQTLQQQLNSAIAELELQIQEQDRQVQDFNALFAEIQENRPQYTQQILATRQSLQTALSRLESQFESLQTQFNQIPDLNSFEGQLTALQGETQTAIAQSENLQNAIATIQENFDRYDLDVLTSVPERLTALSQALVSLEAKFEASREFVAQFPQINQEINNIQALKAQITENSEQQTQTFQDAIARIDERQEDYLKLFQQLAALRAAIGHFEHRLQQIAQNTPTASGSVDLTQIRNQLQSLTQSLASLQSQSERYLQWEDVTSLQDEITFLQNQQPELRNAIAKVNQKNTQLKSQVATQIQQLQQQLNRYEIAALLETKSSELSQQWELDHQFPCFSSNTKAIAIASNQQILAFIQEGYKIQIWDINNNQSLHRLAGHRYHIQALAFSPDSRFLASCSVDKTIKVWDVETGQLHATLTGHSQAVCTVAFSFDGKQVISGSQDNTVRLWDVNTGELTLTLTGHWSAIQGLALSPDGETFASGSVLGTAKVWHLASGELMGDYLLGSQIHDLVYSPNGRILYAACENKTIKRLDTYTGKQLKSLTGHNDAVSAVAIAPSQEILASSSRDGEVKLWSISSNQEISKLQQEDTAITTVRFGNNEAVLVSACAAGFIKVWQQK